MSLVQTQYHLNKNAKTTPVLVVKVLILDTKVNSVLQKLARLMKFGTSCMVAASLNCPAKADSKTNAEKIKMIDEKPHL